MEHIVPILFSKEAFMPPRKKVETKAKAAPKATKPKAAKVAPKPKAPRKTEKATEKAAPVKVAKVSKAAKIPAVKKTVLSKPAIPPSDTKKLPKRGETQMVPFIPDPEGLFPDWEVTPK